MDQHELLQAAERYLPGACLGMMALPPELQDACFAIWRRKFARLRDTAKMIVELGELAGSC